MSNLTTDNTSYLSFDATSVRDLIVKKLNEGEIFTDQNYQGSNLSALIDVISYSFSTLLYYLNKTSSESMFTESQIYENMNRIVKLLNYNPKGKISQTVDYTINSTNDLPAGNYIIPKYSSVSVGGLQFSFNNDVYFTSNNDGVIQVQNSSTDFFLYQGAFNEYPLYNAIGANNEVIFLNLGENVYIDHFNIFVYVKSKITGKWSKWNKTENLFLNSANDNVYELRYNANKNYEIKFGNNINGKALNQDDEIQIYYLNISTESTTIAANSLQRGKITFFNSLYYREIQNDILDNKEYILTNEQLNYIILNNNYPSNPYSQEESVDDIRNNASKNFSYQQRLVTTLDFENFIKNNFNNIFSNCTVVNNEDYLKGHMKYLYNIGLKNPQLDGRILYNQVKFSNSCNFNNVYTYLVPLNTNQTHVNSAQKEFIINELQYKKVLTSDVVLLDPVYMYLDFYVPTDNLSNNLDDIGSSKLIIYKSPNTNKTSSGILNEVVKIMTSTFSRAKNKLGQLVDITQLNSDILKVEGVERIVTYRSDTDTYINGISLLIWNFLYPNLDAKVYNQNVKLEYFQYPIFNDITNIINRISVEEPTGIIQITDF
jgi:hypothetical protein